MTDRRLAERSRPSGTEDAARIVRAHAERLPAIAEHDAFGALFDRYADAKVVLLGEATHGTSEFYRARAAITRRLIERHGFAIVAVEADWPDAARIDACVRHRAPEPRRHEAFTRFPTWMWRNVEVREFVRWMRTHNEAVAPERRAEFRGLDVYSLSSSIDAVLAYLDKVDRRKRRRPVLAMPACRPGRPIRRSTAAPSCTGARSPATRRCSPN
jgi:erythromycin esterase-like protein